MKVTCVGTDPAGLYLGILLKRRDSSHGVRFIEGPADAALDPASFMCNPLKPGLKLTDAETLADVEQALGPVDQIVVKMDAKELATKGLRYAAVDPRALGGLLRRRAESLGCQFEQRDTSR